MRARVPLPEIVPSDTPPQEMSRVIEAESDIVFDPSELCATVWVLEIKVRSPLPPMLPLQVYFVPLIVQDADFVALDEMAEGLFNTNLMESVDVFAVELVAVSVTVKTP